jgi:hypothetical protein
MAVFAAPISFIMACFFGVSGIALPAETDLAMFSLVQAIIFAEAALAVSVAATVIAMNSDFIVSSLAAACCCGTTRNREKSEKFRINAQSFARADGGSRPDDHRRRVARYSFTARLDLAGSRASERALLVGIGLDQARNRKAFPTHRAGRNARPDDPFEHTTETSPSRQRSLRGRENAE